MKTFLNKRIRCGMRRRIHLFHCRPVVRSEIASYVDVTACASACFPANLDHFLDGGFCKTKKKRNIPSHAESADECNALAAVSVGAFCSEIEPFAYEWVGT